ncbi:acyl carrier protein [Ruania rhizosphaerae]|uniref:acyl carrier protein n=1 Tax=Ruania rhizosphaerae TaxID=1840413 RepID=UPI00135A2C94|nr:acyl carrier protein [Ruania rhizosphaerae]
MATNEEVLAALRNVINDVTGIPLEDLALSKSLTDDLDLDSLAIAEIVVAIEDRLSIPIPDEDIKSLVTVSDLVVYAGGRLDGASPHPGEPGR